MATETSDRHSGYRMQQGYEASREAIQEHPLPAALTVFGLGFGLGVALGVLMTSSDDYYRIESNRWERMGRQMVDAIVRAAPEALAKRMS